jgi:hypothetical protein
MPDCISTASYLVIGLSWFSLFCMFSGLVFGIKRAFPRKKLAPLLLLIFAHPVLWSRGVENCKTPLEHSTALFSVLAIMAFIWVSFQVRIQEQLNQEEE